MNVTLFPQQRPSLTFLHEPRSLVAFLCSIVLLSSGCVVTRSVDPQSASAGEVQEALAPGEPVQLLLQDGRAIDLDFEQWTAEHFIGTDQSDLQQSIAWEDISQLQVSRTSGIRTTLLILAVAGFVLGIAASAADYGYNGSL
jgi:hypothetical protein